MQVPSNFDYHLSPAEQKTLERIVPLHQAKIHLAFRAVITFENKVYENAAVALSEHMITVCVPGFLRYSMKYLIDFHLFKIEAVSTLNDQTAVIEFDENSITVCTPVCMRFVRNILRNFILSNPSLPASLRFKFDCHDSSFFPPFKPNLSPSQIFQFTYNAYCSYYDTSYYHEIPMFYHRMLTSGNCIFDLSKLPIKVLEYGLQDSADLNPITSSLVYMPFTYGFVCNNFTRPDVISSVASIIARNSTLRIIKIIDAGSETGCVQIANAMMTNKNCNVIYWDFSKNRLTDVEAFSAALASYNAPVKSIRLNDCQLSDISISMLFQSLTSNESLHGIEEISLLGSRINAYNSGLFLEFLEEISNNEEIPLKSVHLTNVANLGEILAFINGNSFEIQKLSITNTNLSDVGELLADFIHTQKNLVSLALDGCKIPKDDMMMYFNAIGVNTNIKEIDISLADIIYGGEDFEEVISFLSEKVPTKIRSLNLDGCRLGIENLRYLISKAIDFVQLKKLSISRNFKAGTPEISYELAQIANIKTLESIVIRGDDQHKLGDDLIQLICALRISNVRSVDFSHNAIGDIGLKALTNLSLSCTNIESVICDGAQPPDFDEISLFIDALSCDGSLLFAPLPVEDIYDTIVGEDELTMKRHIEKVTDLQTRLDTTLNKNRAMKGIHSDLTMSGDEILNNIIDKATMDLAANLNNYELKTHAAITSIVGLPLPFEPKTSEQTMTQADVDGDNSQYVRDELMEVVRESGSEVDGLKTLQFNSLLIRRPDAAQRIGKAVSSFTFNSASDSYDEEDRELPKPSEFDPDEAMNGANAIDGNEEENSEEEDIEIEEIDA